MKSAAVFLICATLLMIPCYYVSPWWEQVIWSIARGILEAAGVERIRLGLVRFAPFDMAIFTAMSLASLTAPVGRRLRALLIGLPVLAALEPGVMIVAAVISRATAESGLDPTVTDRLVFIPAYGAVYVLPAVAWWLLLGRWYLKAPAR